MNLCIKTIFFRITTAQLNDFLLEKTGLSYEPDVEEKEQYADVAFYLIKDGMMRICPEP